MFMKSNYSLTEQAMELGLLKRIQSIHQYLAYGERNAVSSQGKKTKIQ